MFPDQLIDDFDSEIERIASVELGEQTGIKKVQVVMYRHACTIDRLIDPTNSDPDVDRPYAIKNTIDAVISYLKSLPESTVRELKETPIGHGPTEGKFIINEFVRRYLETLEIQEPIHSGFPKSAFERDKNDSWRTDNWYEHPSNRRKK